MRFHIITLMPELIEQSLQYGVIGRALEKKLFSIQIINPRDFTTNVHKTVDDIPFGGGDGMVLMFEPLAKAVESIANFARARKIYMSPSGVLMRESWVQNFSQEMHHSQAQEIIILCGRYGGVDQRLLNYYNFESLSIGDYVVSGGEWPAMIFIDALMRKQPGVLGNQQSAGDDSFVEDGLLECPSFTRPRSLQAGNAPEILTSGDHKKIREFRRAISLAITMQKRPELVSEELKKTWPQTREYVFQLPESVRHALGVDEKFLTSEQAKEKKCEK